MVQYTYGDPARGCMQSFCKGFALHPEARREHVAVLWIRVSGGRGPDTAADGARLAIEEAMSGPTRASRKCLWCIINRFPPEPVFNTSSSPSTPSSASLWPPVAVSSPCKQVYNIGSQSPNRHPISQVEQHAERGYESNSSGRTVWPCVVSVPPSVPFCRPRCTCQTTGGG